jgi:acetyl-CoA carboxylase, biotin carboxylase subunit
MSPKKILVANRGEVAMRVIRASKELGFRTVAVYSTADSESLPVRLADESVCIGPPAAKDSYLNMQNIIAAAEITGADLIHPGYGFLAESADFVEVLGACKIGFVGPNAEIISKMGHKSQARQFMRDNGIPVIPGSEAVVSSSDEGLVEARNCEFPVMIKAVAGGGGKGMRMVREEKEFSTLFNLARAEAVAAFGNGDLYVEKFIEKPRHIEVQILADDHGNIIHLGERNCSIQRRHQKLLEETPSPKISADLRKKICDTAVKATSLLGYRNAGTLEFLVDAHENFYFMEMNTRLQVEHPVTEMVTGVDIVREQLRIALGERLSHTQDQIDFQGHCMEFRINAEDPKNDFIPSTGKILRLGYPGGPGIRIDTMIAAGDEVLPFYDSMIAKLIVFAPSRGDAILRSRRALEEFELLGIESTVSLHLDILETDTFENGSYTTQFLDSEFLKNREC